MNKEYMFIIGRDPELSKAELFSYLKSRGIEYNLIYENPPVMVFSLSVINPDRLIKDLGGTVKIGEIISSNVESLKEDLEKRILYNGGSRKIKYAISVYKTNPKLGFIRDYIKERFKKEKIRVFFKRSGTNLQYLMPSEVIKHNMVADGVEILVFSRFVARTIAVFNPEEYKERDEKRPAFDNLKVISLRLAKILINLSGIKANQVLLDPFCGYGTILQEAMLEGINVIGVDINKDSCDASLKNLEWIKKRYSLKTKYKVIRGDSTKITRLINTHVDAVVTEPELGPYIKKLPQKEEALKILNRLGQMYNRFLVEAYKILKDGGKLVIITPILKTYNNECFTMPFREMASRTGFRLVQLDTLKLPIRYEPFKHKIERDIYILEK